MKYRLSVLDQSPVGETSSREKAREAFNTKTHGVKHNERSQP